MKLNMKLNIDSFHLKSMSRQTLAYILAALIVLVVAVSGSLFTAGRYARVKRMAAVKRQEHGEFMRLKREFLIKKNAMDSTLRKAYVSAEGRSAIAVVEEIGAMVGVKERITSLKPLARVAEMGFTVSGVEVRIERMDLNQLVNFLYLIENHRTLLVIKEFRLKSRFEDPDYLDVTLKLSHLTKGKS
jgi:general secretion pathway protein M